MTKWSVLLSVSGMVVLSLALIAPWVTYSIGLAREQAECERKSGEYSTRCSHMTVQIDYNREHSPIAMVLISGSCSTVVAFFLSIAALGLLLKWRAQVKRGIIKPSKKETKSGWKALLLALVLLAHCLLAFLAIGFLVLGIASIPIV